MIRCLYVQYQVGSPGADSRVAGFTSPGVGEARVRVKAPARERRSLREGIAAGFVAGGDTGGCLGMGWGWEKKERETEDEFHLGWSKWLGAIDHGVDISWWDCDYLCSWSHRCEMTAESLHGSNTIFRFGR